LRDDGAGEDSGNNGETHLDGGEGYLVREKGIIGERWRLKLKSSDVRVL